MYWHKMDRPGGGYWRCREKRKKHDAERWASYYAERMPTSVRYGPRYLKNRHAKALQRRRDRRIKEGLDG